MGTTAVASSFAEPSMYPLHRCKIIHVVRHGQGYHNVAGNVDLKNYESWDFVDASLTELGWRQAEALHDHLVTTHIRNHVELVVVSPLLRTLQTAVGVWGGGTLLDGEPPHSALMRPGVGHCRHPAISSAGAPPFVANEWCREQNGVHPCDKRSSISSYKVSFPAVDFSQVETDEDTWWQATNRETPDEIWTRARVFLKWILERTERRIGVVSHSSFLYYLVHLFGDDCSDTVRKEFQAGFRNCEMRSFIICDRRATSAPSGVNTDFRGGLYFGGQSETENADQDKSAGKQVAGPSLREEFDSEAWFEVRHPDDLPTAPQIPKPSRKLSRPPPRKPSRKSSRKQSQPDLDDPEEKDPGGSLNADLLQRN
ncbi:hypothetical protein KC19_12G107400 [Ceratodon purpureus]|uniref:Phosphoglycerate mutase-like protein n=1 Tax=Ceratodon purpureus TaxID=3225 RepID=A0A8T0G9U9_CERPU|nr:hypothetical protein KC19_12G107400 [Ceratodon purpureus]